MSIFNRFFSQQFVFLAILSMTASAGCGWFKEPKYALDADDFEIIDEGPPKVKGAFVAGMTYAGGVQDAEVGLGASVNVNVPTLVSGELSVWRAWNFAEEVSTSFQGRGFVGYPFVRGASTTAGSYALSQSTSGNTTTTKYVKINVPSYRMWIAEGGITTGLRRLFTDSAADSYQLVYPRVGIRNRAFYHVRSGDTEVQGGITWWAHAVLPPIGKPDGEVFIADSDRRGDAPTDRPLGLAFGLEGGIWMNSFVNAQLEVVIGPFPHSFEALFNIKYELPYFY